MKLLRTLLFLGLAVIPVSASEADARRAEETGKTYKVFKTRLNQIYRDVTVTNITDAGITIIHADGSTRLGFERLSPEQREAFGITRQGAEAMRAKELEAKAAYEAHIAAKQKKWQDEQQQQQLERQKVYQEQQKAHQELLAKQMAARLEAQSSKPASSVVQPVQGALEGAQELQASTNTTSIVSMVEVPHFPIIRGTDNQILYPIQNSPRTHRRSYSRSGNTIYSGSYGGNYGYPVRYGSSCGSYGYPSRGGAYRPSHHRGSYGAINYRKGNFSISTRW